MRTLKGQKGASMLGWLIVVSMVGIIGMAALKLAPHYMGYYSIASTLDDMQVDPSLKGVSKNVIIATFNKRLSVNNVRSITKEHVTITKIQGKKAFLMEVNYQVREPLFGNLSIVADFSRSGEVGGG